MVTHLTTALVAALALAAEPAPPAADAAPARTPLGRVAFEAGLGGGVTSEGYAAPIPHGSVLLVLRDRYALGVVATGDLLGFGERDGTLTSGPPGSFRFSLPDAYFGLTGGVRGDLGGRWGELLLEFGLHRIWLAPEDWDDWDDDNLEVDGSEALPYLGARGLLQVAGPFAVGAAVRADLGRERLEGTTHENGVRRDWSLGQVGGVSAVGFVAVAFDLAFGRGD
jgi:hypothetical protein